ncbi:galanin receptor 2b-like [Branchiostoma lanceolatum]|uniref:galanin receptor 2b-like n=1 Tax=Branchiostoma lanceolatum TaxID=7740 RepID=UPI003452F6C1
MLDVCLMIITMVLIFAICWLPTQVLLLWQVIASEDFPFTLVTFSWKITALILTYLQSAVSPVVYMAFGQTFRRKLKQAFPRMFQSNRVNQLQAVPLRTVGRAAGGLAAGRIAGARPGNNGILPSTTRRNPVDHEPEDVFGGVWNRNRNRNPAQMDEVAGAFVITPTPRCADVGYRKGALRQMTPRSPTCTSHD